MKKIAMIMITIIAITSCKIESRSGHPEVWIPTNAKVTKDHGNG